MLTFFLIPDTNRFLKLASKSFGDVFLHMPDGTRHNLKCSGNACQMLDTARSRNTGVKIDLTDRRDMEPFIRYMAEAAL